MKNLLFISFILFGIHINAQVDPMNITVSVDQLELSFNTKTRTFELHDTYEGLILSAGIFRADIGGEVISTSDHKIDPIIINNSGSILSMQFGDHFVVTAQLLRDTMLIFSTHGESADSVWFTARAPLSERTLGCLLQNQQEDDQNTVVQTLGVQDVPGISSIFDPMKDLAIQVESQGKVAWEHNYQWQLNASAKVGQDLVSIKLFRHYYRDTLGITYYAPIKKRGYFQKAPALAMTWVGIEGKFNRPNFSQRKEWLYPNIDWVSEKLLPYAEEMIFQLDDNYPIDDPQYMRDISDYIRSKNLIPGIWIAPFGVAPFEEEKEHPEWFIHKADGSPITTFSGLSYDDVKHYISNVLNVNSNEGVEKWFAGFLKQVNEVWNYDYYKVDGIPAVLTVYKQSVDGGGVEGVRRGLQIFRDVVGPEKYINTCWGLPLEGIDIVNGSRVGGDTEQLNQVVSRVAIAQNYLNNVAWYSDPDGAANMYASTPARARLNFQGRSILGQPYVTDDCWTKVPDEILFVWQRTLPTIESFPTNLYEISDPEKYDHINLKIKMPWGEWDILSLNNYENKARQLTLDLGRLPLSAEEVYVYDFWNQKYLGKYSPDAKIVRNMEAIDAQCFSIVPVINDRPVLISTSRHYTQGGIDLVDVKQWKAEDVDKDTWYFHGKSSHLIKDDPYDLVFVSNGYDLNKALVTGGKVEILKDDSWVSRLRIIPDGPELDWKLVFILDNKEIKPFVMELVSMEPSPENIAVQAKATASSVYFWGDQNGYGRPEGANDGRTFRAWEAKEGETAGWLELTWEKPVTFQRIVIDEWMESGGFIQSWELEAGHKRYEYTPRKEKVSVVTYDPGSETMNLIKKGDTIGRNFVIDLDKPITVNVLRLNIIRASERPGVWEIEVY